MLRTDVAGFGASYRTDEHRLIIRRAQYQITRQAICDAGIPLERCHCEDRGDGVLLVVPHEVRTGLLVYPFVDLLITGLTRYNARADAATSIQLRAALHVGPVTTDPPGVSGEVIITASRLVECPALKKRLTTAKAQLGFITSTFVYDSVVKQRPGHVNPADYERVEFQSKDSQITGWMYLGGAQEDERAFDDSGRYGRS